MGLRAIRHDRGKEYPFYVQLPLCTVLYTYSPFHIVYSLHHTKIPFIYNTVLFISLSYCVLVPSIYSTVLYIQQKFKNHILYYHIELYNAHH